MIGQCLLSCIPVRSDARSQAEMVTQILYGETYEVIEKQKDWYFVRLDFDGYEGWISSDQYTDQSFKSLAIQSEKLFTDHEGVLVPLSGEMADKSSGTTDIFNLAKMFLGCPYLWGGKTFMGIDCSGFMQVLHKAIGMSLPRDASQQVTQGIGIEFGKHKPGDLAFFQNEKGKVTHVGLIWSETEIIHAAGHVRIDSLNAEGITRLETGQQSHAMHSVRRLV